MNRAGSPAPGPSERLARYDSPMHAEDYILQAGAIPYRARPDGRLEVLLINGIYDLATPYFAAVWTMDRMGLPPDLRDNIQRADFAAGHMMYVEEALLPQWKETLDTFLDRTSGASRPVS